MAERSAEAPVTGRRRLSRQRVLETALDVVRQEGADRLSLRAVSQRLGVTPMALYNHFENKNDLLAGVLDLLVREAAAFDHDVPRDDWRAWTKESFLGMYASLRDHPGLVALTVGLDELTPATREASGLALTVLRDAGFSAEDAVRLFATLSRFVLGSVMLPMLRVSPPEVVPQSPDDSVRAGIETIIDGFAFSSLVEARLGRSTQPSLDSPRV
ncbi:MAG: TetR family transcriptional regulator [Myxococcota bacterium]